MRVYLMMVITTFIYFNCNVNLDAEVLYTEEEALAYILPGADNIEKEVFYLTAKQKKKAEKKLRLRLESGTEVPYTFYAAYEGAGITGYAYIDEVEGKYGTIRYIVGVSSGGIVSGVVILEFQEVRGKKIKRKEFLSQFIGSFFKGKLRTKKKIQAVTGATISTQAVISGVKKALLLYNEFYDDKK